MNLDALAYRPYYLTEYCRREYPPSSGNFTFRLQNEGEYRDFNDLSIRDRRDNGMPSNWYRNRLRGVGVLSDRIQHVSRREKEYAFRELGPETQAQRDRRAQRARDLGVPDAEVDEIEPNVPELLSNSFDRVADKLVTETLPKSTPSTANVPEGSCGLSMPWDTGSQVSGLDASSNALDVEKIKVEAKKVLRKQLEKKILGPMRTKLRGSGMIAPGGSAEKILPSLDSVGEHYCGIVSQLGKAAELFKLQKDQLAVSETNRNVSVKEVNKLKLQGATAKSAATAALSKFKAEH